MADQTPISYIKEHLLTPFGDPASVIIQFKKQYPADYAELIEQAKKKIAAA